ncbi:hypothetical protein AOQ84DRAFT_351133 [Glonium stellatum]|uniref:Uncharacterized protein n=1 Tax=Glonium stellatum TaxID=574774 RepID=A0A8E2JZY9_9PEZI|nr:hypothetical protein AOQ84DRAFT_351133 [Glonium stellatum]
MITREQCLDILGLVASTGGRMVGLPSWVPDWTAQFRGSPLPKRRWTQDENHAWLSESVYHVSRALSPTITVNTTLDEGILHCQGIIIDEIASTSSEITPANRSVFEDFLTSLGGRSTPYVAGGNMLTAFEHTLCADARITESE